MTFWMRPNGEIVIADEAEWDDGDCPDCAATYHLEPSEAEPEVVAAMEANGHKWGQWTEAGTTTDGAELKRLFGKG